MSHYRLDENKNAVPCTFDEWATQYEEMSKKHEKHIGEELIDGKRISTIWLGLDHQFGHGRPLLFETMIFEPADSGRDIYCDRYSTWDEAEKGHKKAIEWVKNGCKGEDK